MGELIAAAGQMFVAVIQFFMTVLEGILQALGFAVEATASEATENGGGDGGEGRSSGSCIVSGVLIIGLFALLVLGVPRVLKWRAEVQRERVDQTMVTIETHVERLAAEYGLPTASFHGSGRDLGSDDHWSEALYRSIDTRKSPVSLESM